VRTAEAARHKLSYQAFGGNSLLSSSTPFRHPLKTSATAVVISPRPPAASPVSVPSQSGPPGLRRGRPGARAACCLAQSNSRVRAEMCGPLYQVHRLDLSTSEWALVAWPGVLQGLQHALGKHASPGA
jgi:hypothetical protein